MRPYHRWPFLPASMRTLEQNSHWWESCFLPILAIENFISVEGSAAVVANSGCGKSTALECLVRAFGKKALFLYYPTHNWPQGLIPRLPGKGHVSQIMSIAAIEIATFLDKHPQVFAEAKLTPLQLEFLCWLVEKHLRHRVLVRLAYRLQQSTAATIELPEQFIDIYPSDTQEADVWGQIGELVELAQALGFEQVLLLIDLNAGQAISYLDDLMDLLDRLDLLEHPGWAIRAALPQLDVVESQLLARSSGRLNLIRLQYDELEIEEIISRYLETATEGRDTRLEMLADSAVLERASREIKKLYGVPTLAGWLNWTETLLALHVSSASANLLSDPEQAVYAFYKGHVPLRLELNQQGAWRGPQFIPLDRQPFELLKTLFHLRGQPAPDALLDLAGSRQNLNTLASRLGKELEPARGLKIYLHNRRDQGYWLENFIF